MASISCILTPAQGKALIARAVLARGDVQAAAREHTLVIVAGSTDAPIAETMLKQRGEADDFCAAGFLRGAIRPAPKEKLPFPGDVIIRKGEYLRGKTVLDIGDELGRGDLIIKGANAVHLPTAEAAVLIGSPVLGTAGAILPAVIGRKAKLLVPVGVEKRVDTPIGELCRRVNVPNHKGPGLLALPGEVITEGTALQALCQARATLIAAGGIEGHEGASMWMVEGEPDALERCTALIRSL